MSGVRSDKFEIGQMVKRPRGRAYTEKDGIVIDVTDQCAIIKGEDGDKYFTDIKVNHSFWGVV